MSIIFIIIIIIITITPGCSVFPGAAQRHKHYRFNDAEKILHEEDGAQVHVWFHHGEPLLHWGGAPGQQPPPSNILQL